MTTEAQVAEQQDQFLRQYWDQGALIGASEPNWLASQRQEAIHAFIDAGYPTTQEEDWRYTNINPITQTPFHFPTVNERMGRAALENASQWQGDAAARLVFHNGIYLPNMSHVGALPAGVIVTSLRALLQPADENDILRVYLGRSLNYQRRPFADLNSALWLDGACIFIPREVGLKAPVHLAHIFSAEHDSIACHPRVLLVCERDAQATVVETLETSNGGICFSNTVTEIVAGENSVVDYYRSVQHNPQSFSLGLVQIYAGRSAQVSAFVATFGGGIVRNEVHANLDAEGADCSLNGLYVARGLEHVDHHTTIDHAKPHGSSRQLYNGILDDRSTAVFNGRVIVRPDAQKTDAVQNNRNLLLSADATIDTKPQLEISANDVRCTHGATVGQMDEEALFFLRSRGLAREQASALLVQAFAGETLDKVKVPGLREWLETKLQTNFLHIPGDAR